MHCITLGGKIHIMIYSSQICLFIMKIFKWMSVKCLKAGAPFSMSHKDIKKIVWLNLRYYYVFPHSILGPLINFCLLNRFEKVQCYFKYGAHVVVTSYIRLSLTAYSPFIWAIPRGACFWDPAFSFPALLLDKENAHFNSGL